MLPLTSSVDVYLNCALIGVEVVPLRSPSRTQHSWALEGKQRKRERDKNISKRTEEEKLQGFMWRKGFVWNVFCVMRRPNSALWNSVTWSWKIEISLFSPSPHGPGCSQLTLGLSTISRKHCRTVFFSDLVVRLVVRRGCHFRSPAGRLLRLLGHSDTALIM